MLFHYTSQEGFKGIVQEDGIHLWVSDARYMNDRSELVNAWKFFMQAAQELVDENKIDEEIFEIIKSINHHHGGFSLTRLWYGGNCPERVEVINKILRVHKYICCFSKEKDSLPMWNYYLKNDCNGYAIGLNRKKLETFCKEFSPQENKKYVFSEIRDVLYNDVKKVKIFKEGLCNFRNDIFKNMTKGSDPQAIAGLRMDFEKYATICKDYHFAYENEVRMITTVRNLECFGTKEKQCGNVNFRLAHGFAIPYIEIHIPNKEILEAITLSPRIGLNSNDEDTIESVRSYLNYLGYTHDIEILCSEIPLRYY